MYSFIKNNKKIIIIKFGKALNRSKRSDQVSQFQALPQGSGAGLNMCEFLLVNPFKSKLHRQTVTGYQLSNSDWWGVEGRPGLMYYTAGHKSQVSRMGLFLFSVTVHGPAWSDDEQQERW